MARRSRLKTEDNRRRRLHILLIFLMILGGAAGIGVAYHQQLANMIDIWRETFPAGTQAINSDRGTIYDRNFKELAQTLERVSLYARPRETTDIPETARQLSKVLGLAESEIIVRMERDAHLVWLRRDIGQEDEEAVTRLSLPGIYLHREVARDYPQQEYASQLIGYSENDLGLSGVEHYYNRLLNQDRVRQEDFPAIDLKGLTQTGVEGHDLVLTLDMKIQGILEKYVKGLGKEMGKGRVTSLLLDVVEGKIVAGASYPSFNPNSVKYEQENLENLLLTPMVVPEEIRKFFRDASLLQGGWEQGTQVYPWSLVSAKVDLGSQLRLWERLQLTTDIQVDFSGGRNQVKSLPCFEGTRPPLDLGAVPKTASPLKVLLGMTSLLNGGKKIQPHILDRILERPGLREYYYNMLHGESPGRNVFPALVSRELKELLHIQGKRGVLGSVSLSGESVSLVANDSGAGYVRDRMTLVVIPAKEPELILLLVARDEELTVQKSVTAGFRGLGDKVDTILPSMVALQQVHQNLADMMEVADGEEQNFQGGSDQDSGRAENLSRMLEGQIQKMPDLTGMSMRKSLRLLQSSKVRVTVRGTGRVVSQSPEAGKEIKKGDLCLLTLKIDPAPKDGRPIENIQVKETLSE